MNEKRIESDILIIGAGLTGLYLSYLLREMGRKVMIVEARSILGGRILTKEDGINPPLEMGATWFGYEHSHLQTLISELGLRIFEQKLGDRAIYEPISSSPPQIVKLPPNDRPSFRFIDGTDSIIKSLANEIESKIHLNQIIQKVELDTGGINAHTINTTYHAKFIVSTIPPALLQNSVEFIPELPEKLLSVTASTHTWMGDSIKVALAYEDAFWDTAELSGTIFSSVGPIPEMYDHSNYDHNKHALMGFLNGTYFSLQKSERLELILTQLEKYYGPQVRGFVSYEEKVWRNDPFTFFPYRDHVLPHQNNGHAIYQDVYLDNRFILAGSETCADFGGYMEGALRSARFVFDHLYSCMN